MINRSTKFFLNSLKDIESKAEPDFRAWWAQQPEDLVQDCIDKFESCLSLNGSDESFCMMNARAQLADIERFSWFHRGIKREVEAAFLMNGGRDIKGNDIHWRLLPPKINGNSFAHVSEAVKKAMLKVIEASERNIK